MKNKILKNIKTIVSYILTLSVIASSFGFISIAQAAEEPILTIGSQTASNGATINVPINASNFVDVAGITLTGIQFDNTLLSYTGFTLNTLPVSGSLVNLAGNQININWSDLANPLNVSNSTLLILNFTVISTTTTNANLTFVGTKEINDSSANSIDASFINGIISLNPDTIAPTLSSYTISETIISPNNDGIKDSSSIDIKYSEKVNAEINILDNNGVKVRDLYSDPSVTNPQAKVWNGKNNSNAVVPDGVYTIQILGTDPAGNILSDTSKTITVDTAVLFNSAKDITAFSFSNLGSGVITGNNIIITVPFGTDVAALIPVITITGATVSPLSGTAQDFTSPVTYTVTAENSSTQTYVVTVNFSTNPDIALLTTDKVALVDNSIKGGNSDLSHITTTLANPLPSSGSNGSAITWTSSNPSVVSNDGQTINKPTFASGNITVTLTATITKGGLTDTKIFTLIVLRLPASTVATVTSGAYIVSMNGTATENITNVPFGTEKATFLTALTKSEINQIWDETGITDPVVTGNTLAVTAQDGITKITYTITTSDNPDIALITSDRDALVESTIKGVNIDLSNVTGTLAILPVVGSTNGSIITWTSSNPSVVSNDGQTINRPAFADGNMTITLTATLVKSSIAQTKIFTLIVLKLPASVIATITSGTYTVNDTNSTITGIPYGTTSSTFLAGLTKGESHQTWNSSNLTNPVVTGNTLVVTAQDGSTTKTYTLTVDILASTQIAPDNTGAVTINNATPQVVIANRTQATTITIGSGTTTPTINVSSFITNGTGTLPAITITSVNANNTHVTIPASTTVTSADNTWSGIISAPTITTVTLPETSGQTKTFSTAIEIGFTGAKLSFDKAVRILLPNQAGKRAGYIRTGITFTEIENTCVADNQTTGDALAVDGECKIDVGSDLVIWTKHFTSFATYTQTTNNTGGGGGGGGSVYYSPNKAITAFTIPEQVGATTINEITHTITLTMPYGTNIATLIPTITITGKSISPLSATSTNFTTPKTYTVLAANGSTQTYVVTVVIAPTISIPTIILGCGNRTTGFSVISGQSCVGNIGTNTQQAGQVLGASSFNFTKFMKSGSKGNEVIELQKFLNNAGYNVGTADGKFGSKTKAAVIKFQLANKLKGDGVVGKGTRAILNK